MNKKNRDRLLALARILDAAAARLRRYVAAKTPKRGPRKNSAPNADLKAMSTARNAAAEESA